MATDLVRWGHAPDGDQGWEDDSEEKEDEWDRPPVAPRPHRNSGPILDGRGEFGARRAERDAEDASARGDISFAKLRGTDAAEQRQKRFDWGDLRTWVWIVGMSLGFLLVAAFIYYMPQGRHNQNDGANPTPGIRVY